jgi:sporulation protein YlmC with PRC-barrel domain
MHNLEEEEQMSRLSTAASFAAIIAVATPAAFAQTKATPENRTEATGAAANKMSIQPDQIRASKMLGGTVYDSQNRNIGSVKDLVLDKNGEIDEVVIDIGAVLGVGGKYVAVKMSDIKADNNRLTLDRTKEQLQQMAEYQLENRNTGAGTSTSPTTGGHLGR